MCLSLAKHGKSRITFLFLGGGEDREGTESLVVDLATYLNLSSKYIRRDSIWSCFQLVFPIIALTGDVNA